MLVRVVTKMTGDSGLSGKAQIRRAKVKRKGADLVGIRPFETKSRRPQTAHLSRKCQRSLIG
jgi:hypothetical protein